MQERHESVAKLFATGEWRPTDPGCIQTFTELVKVLDAEIDSIAPLSQTMPPLELRGVHREMTRAAIQFVRCHVFAAQTICAVDADEAACMQVDATGAMAAAAKHLKRVPTSSA
jgi:hypothetical protein